MMFNKQRETLQQVAGLYMPAWAVRASCIFSISESISMFCVRASQEESLLADRVAQLSSLCLKLPLGQSGLSERSSAGATLELACRGNQREDDALRTARAPTGESNEMGKICLQCLLKKGGRNRNPTMTKQSPWSNMYPNNKENNCALLDTTCEKCSQ